jgi:hypothetical protein
LAGLAAYIAGGRLIAQLTDPARQAIQGNIDIIAFTSVK